MMSNGILDRDRWSGLIGLMVVTLVALSSHLSAEEPADLESGLKEIKLADLKRHVSTLASDALEGREAGSRGGKAALAYLRSELKAIKQLGRIDREQTQEFGRDYQNLLVLMPGSDERQKKEVIVIGAHYDHVGYGKPTNSQGPFGHVHNGADDNASGTSALLELIQAFSTLETPPARSILFCFWDAEEAGLLGSKHWVGHPTLPLRAIRLMINLDMLGRLRDSRVLASGWRSAPGLRQLVSQQNTGNDLKVAFQSKLIADSDHWSFYEAGIPVLHFDTDKHEDYHRPSDDAEKLNWTGLETLTKFVFRFANDVANRTELPKFREESRRETAQAWLTPQPPNAPPIRLGVTWDLEAAKQNQAVIAQVTPESPAARAGLKAKDRIIRLGDWENGSLEEVRTLTQIVKNPVSIRVIRAGTPEPLDVMANLWGEPIRLGAGWAEDSAVPNCVAITHTVAESPADRAGILAGDLILEMGGRPVRSSEEMRQRVTEEPGPFQFRIERFGRIREVTVELMDNPSQKTVSSTSR